MKLHSVLGVSLCIFIVPLEYIQLLSNETQILHMLALYFDVQFARKTAVDRSLLCAFFFFFFFFWQYNQAGYMVAEFERPSVHHLHLLIYAVGEAGGLQGSTFTYRASDSLPVSQFRISRTSCTRSLKAGLCFGSFSQQFCIILYLFKEKRESHEKRKGGHTAKHHKV